LLAPVTKATLPSSRRSTATPSVSLQHPARPACSLASRAFRFRATADEASRPVGELDGIPNINDVEDPLCPP